MIPVSASRLRHRRIRCTDGDLRDVTLFPFFDRAGDVRAVLAVDHAEGRLRWTRNSDGLFKARWLARPRFSAPRSALRDVTPDDAVVLSNLWHFDPWWMLTESPFDMHWATPSLKATNCADLLTVKQRGMYFRRDLSAIRSILANEKGEWKFQDWNPDNLPAQQYTRRARRFRHTTTKPRRGPTWRLDPIWTR